MKLRERIGLDIGRRAKIEDGIDAAIKSGRPTVIDAVVDPAEYWEQM